MLEKNKMIVHRFLEQSIGERRFVNELCAQGFAAHIGASLGMDSTAFHKYENDFYESFTDNSISIEEMIAEGDMVAFRLIVSAKHTGDFQGIPASNNNIAVPVIGMARIEKDLITEWWNSPDKLSWMQQISGKHS